MEEELRLTVDDPKHSLTPKEVKEADRLWRTIAFDLLRPGRIISPEKVRKAEDLAMRKIINKRLH